jgi:hypothetical protein
MKRAKKIARTEVCNVSNYGSLAGAKQTGLILNKIWIPTTSDNKTRPTHKKARFHPPISLNAYFKIGRANLQHPGDPDGPSEEIINCRCAIGYRRVKK